MMKVHKITALWMFLLLFAFTACNDDAQDSILPDNDNQQYREIHFYPQETPRLKNTQSFWHWYERFYPGDRIGVFAIEKGWRENGNSDRAFAHNKCFYFDGERFLPRGDEDRIFVRNEQLEFYAYYPYTPVMDHSGGMILNFTVSPYQDRDYHDDYPWGYRENNLMAASYTQEPLNDMIPLVFGHCMALVGIDIYHGLDRQSSNAVLTRKYISSHVDISDPKLQMTGDTIKYDVNMLEVYSRDGITSYMVLVPEQPALKDTVLFRLNVSGVEYKHYPDRDSKLMAGTGNYYKFTLPCTIRLNETVGGSVTGGGTYNCGDHVTVSAKADSGYNFTGWYENDIKVSNYQYYSFNANGDRLLEARFERLW